MNDLTVEHLSKTYKGRKVVQNVSLTTNRGRIIGLLGPNGAGKTTCFYMILGLVSTETGKIYIGNKDVTSAPVHDRAQKGLSYLPQEPSIFRKLNVEDNIMAILETRKDLNTTERQTKLESLIQEFNVGHVRKTLGMSLSGGERRRVEIARALATDPLFILLDEPFAGVDPISIIDIKAIIKHLANRNIGVIITDHNVRETLDICDMAYIMNAGKVIAKGSAADILANKQVRQVYLGEEFSI